MWSGVFFFCVSGYVQAVFCVCGPQIIGPRDWLREFCQQGLGDCVFSFLLHNPRIRRWRSSVQCLSHYLTSEVREIRLYRLVRTATVVYLGLCSVYISNVYRKLYLVYELLCIEVMEKIEENVYLEGYNSLPLRRKNCKKYRRASDVTSVNKAVLPERRFTSVHGVEDHGIGQADCRFCLEREVHSLACSGFSSRVKYLLWLY